MVGLIRFIWEYSYGPAPPCGDEDHRHYLIANLHYMHFGVMLFGLVGLVTITISLLTKPIAEEYVSIPFTGLFFHSDFGKIQISD